EVLGLVVVLDDLDALAAELVADGLHAEPTLADARADRVEPGLTRADGDLRPRPGLARDTRDLHLPVVDLRHLELEEALHQSAVRAAHDDLRAVDRAADLQDEH